jgi:hypothetical protein
MFTRDLESRQEAATIGSSALSFVPGHADYALVKCRVQGSSAGVQIHQFRACSSLVIG